MKKKESFATDKEIKYNFWTDLSKQIINCINVWEFHANQSTRIQIQWVLPNLPVKKHLKCWHRGNWYLTRRNRTYFLNKFRTILSITKRHFNVPYIRAGQQWPGKRKVNQMQTFALPHCFDLELIGERTMLFKWVRFSPLCLLRNNSISIEFRTGCKIIRCFDDDINLIIRKWSGFGLSEKLIVVNDLVDWILNKRFSPIITILSTQ